MKLLYACKTAALALVLSLSASLAWGVDDEANLLIFEQKSAGSEQIRSEAQEVVVQLDPSEVAETEKFHRENFIKRARLAMKADIPKDVVYEFEGPGTEAELERLLQLPDAEIEVFLAKKKAFLGKFARVLRFFKVSPAKVNKALNELNARFYESSHVVSKSNVKGGTVMFSISAGLALPQKVMEAMRARSIGNFVPASGGFYYMLGLGAGFSRQVGADGKARFVFELFLDVEKLKKTLTGIAEVSAAGTYGLVFEKREGSIRSQKSTTMYGGATGVFRQGSQQFGWAASTGMSLPPGIGILLVYQDEATRYYLFRTEGLRASFPALAGFKDNIVSALRSFAFNRGKIIRCDGALL